MNGENSWEEYDAYGVLRHDDEPTVSEEGHAVSVAAAGEPPDFAYRVVVHDGTWDAERVDAAHEDYVRSRA